MIAIGAEGLSVSFGVKRVLEDVSFSLEEGDRLGIVGVNGCGKSTLLSVLCGEREATAGNVHISKEKSIGVLRQNDAFAEFSDEEGTLTALEVTCRSFGDLLEAEKRLLVLEEKMSEGDRDAAAQYASLYESFVRDGGLEFRGRCASTLLKMGFSHEDQLRPVCDFSGGQRTRLALSRELSREPDILMLDEPTNHLDTETLTWLESFLSGYKKTLIVISHDRYFLDRVTNKTLYIENTRAKLYGGSYTRAMEQRRVEREIEERHYKNQQKEIARQEAYIAKQRQWNRERNIIAAESRLKMLDKMEKLERPDSAPRGVRMRFGEAMASGNDVISVKGLSFGYTSTPIFSDVSFTLKRGERLFITGPNGCGKSTLLKLLLGRLTATAGYAEFGYNVRLGYYDQENQELSAANTVLEELWGAYPALTELEIRSTLAQFCFYGDDVHKLVGDLSGGERARLTLARLMLSDTNLLVLDEPTNHLDVSSREALEGALAEYEGTVVTVSHDRYFIDKLATSFIDMRDGRAHVFAVASVGRGYAELLSERERLFAPSEAQSATGNRSVAASAAKEQYLQSKQERADKRNAEKRLERLRAEAKRIEDEIDAIDTEMNGSAATDYARLAELDEKKNALEARLLEIYDEI